MSNPRPPQNLIEYCTDDPNNNDIKAIMSAYAIRLLVDSVKTFWKNAETYTGDLNDLYEPGLYRIDSSSVTHEANEGTNNYTGYIWVIRWGTNVKQIIFVNDWSTSKHSIYSRSLTLTLDGSGQVVNVSSSTWFFYGNTRNDKTVNNAYETLTSGAIHQLIDDIKTFWERADYAVGVDINTGDFIEPGLWRINGNGSPASQNLPENEDGFLWTMRQESFVSQIWVNSRQDIGDFSEIFVRKAIDISNNTWSAWRRVAFQDTVDAIKTFWKSAELRNSNVNVNNLQSPGLYLVDGNQGTVTNTPESKLGFTWVQKYSNYIVQIWYNAQHESVSPDIYIRKTTNGTNWTTWRKIAFSDELAQIKTIYDQANYSLSSQNVDMNDKTDPGIYYVNADQSGYTYSNVPAHEDALMIVYRYSSYIKQMWLNTEGGHDDRVYTRYSTNSGATWSDWSRILSHDDERVQRDILLPGNWVQDAGANSALMIETNLKYIFQWNLRPVRLYNLFTGLAVKGSSNARIRIVVVRQDGTIDNLTDIIEPQAWNTSNGRKWLNSNYSQILTSYIVINTGDRIEIQLHDGYSNTDDSEDLTISMEFKRIF